MRRIVTLLALGLPLTGTISVATADSFPHRKNGLWETSMHLAQHPGTAINSQQCIDEKSDADMQRRLMDGGPSLNCERTDFRKTADGFEGNSVCKTSHSKLTSKMVIKGDLHSVYRMEISSHRDPPQGGMTNTQSVVDAKWLGACPTDMKPGDLRINGMIVRSPVVNESPAATRTPTGNHLPAPSTPRH